ncbi:unnamed protein product (macronuclear) [Paramecium tetraurelia]|uniref:RING-type domain-containing protein n=1 Tax=Paramecium tetraurelia TaxID=5888 RepID=A0DTK4_PARTE|nr:uncharacterized protein GSPATT00020052001 [Paramecium tetraurelia]CAK86371.1 unnamed protein product [Paramecium tetraurelia]|eukprot:XP_001453768.1 hypothetical protein (macronuclear) [Paramecium tetraurelia strain d4-2]
MINTFTFGLLLLYFYEVFAVQFELFISKGFLYSQKRIVNTNSSNTTFIVNCHPQYANYCTIDLNQTSQKAAEIALLFLEAQPPYLDKDDGFIFDGMDYDSYVQKKRNHFIQIPSSYSKIYFTVLTNIPISFDIYLTGSSSMLCPNNCQENGDCLQGECKCGKGFISRDCSMRALQLEQEKPMPVNGSHDPNFYCYYEYNGTQDLRLEITTENEAQIYLLVPNLLYLPTPNFFDNSAIITRTTPLNITIEQRKSNSYEWGSQIPDKLIILIQGSEFIIRLNRIDDESKSEQVKSIIIVVCSVTGFLLFCFCIFIIRRARQRKSVEKQTPDDFEIKENQFIYGRSQSKKEDDQYATIDNQLQPSNLQDNCAICLDPLCNQQPVNSTPCNSHIFHVYCIQQWLQKNQFCPFCRFDLKINNLQQQNQQPIKVPMAIANQLRIVRRNI